MVQLYGQIKNPDGTTKWKPIEATLLEDGTYAIKVDTELVLDGASVTISNIKIGSVNQTVAGSRFIKTEDDGTVVTAVDNAAFTGYKGARSQDTGAFPHYYGLVDSLENVIIIRESKTGSVSTFEYFAGAGDFLTSWTGRAGLAYDEFYNVF